MIDILTFIDNKKKEAELLKKKKQIEKEKREFKKLIRKPEFLLMKYLPVPEINEDEIEVEERNCSFFGCGKVLSMREKMFGSRCVNHQIKNYDSSRF